MVWTDNSRNPLFTGQGLIDIYLNRADTGETIFSVINLPIPSNQAGAFPFTVNDTVIGKDGLAFNGENISYPMEFRVAPPGTPENQAIAQPIFTVIRKSSVLFL